MRWCCGGASTRWPWSAPRCAGSTISTRGFRSASRHRTTSASSPWTRRMWRASGCSATSGAGGAGGSTATATHASSSRGRWRWSEPGARSAAPNTSSAERAPPRSLRRATCYGTRSPGGELRIGELVPGLGVVLHVRLDGTFAPRTLGPDDRQAELAKLAAALGPAESSVAGQRRVPWIFADVWPLLGVIRTSTFDLLSCWLAPDAVAVIAAKNGPHGVRVGTWAEIRDLDVERWLTTLPNTPLVRAAASARVSPPSWPTDASLAPPSHPAARRLRRVAPQAPAPTARVASRSRPASATSAPRSPAPSRNVDPSPPGVCDERTTISSSAPVAPSPPSVCDKVNHCTRRAGPGDEAPAGPCRCARRLLRGRGGRAACAAGRRRVCPRARVGAGPGRDARGRRP
jgi:hypothetical protein